MFCNAGMPEDAWRILERTAGKELDKRQIALAGEKEAAGAYRVTASVCRELKDDAFRLIPAPDGVSVEGASVCAVFHGTGVLLRRLRPDGRGGFTRLEKELFFTPEKPLRGIYFATHFHNFYHSAPLEAVYERVALSAMRGYNELLVWFDMHHYSSMEEPAAQKMVQRLHIILAYANTVGMGASMLHLANEGFDSSPVELRARFELEGGYRKIPLGHYNREICPSLPGGTEEILRERREMMRYFSDLRLDYLIYWPYDQGGCTCSACQPWGGNGYLKLFAHYRDMMRELMPDTGLILSTWFFDHFTDGESEAFFAAVNRGELSDVAYVMSPKDVTGYAGWEKMKWISFPEISMYQCAPWGGFGASQIAGALQSRLCGLRGWIAGGFPYSEGIFEDANEFMVAGFYTGEFRDMSQALREYVAWEFCCEDEELFAAVLATESTLKRRDEEVPGDACGVRYVIEDPAQVRFAWETFERYEKLLPEKITKGTPFRLFRLRTLIDHELVTHDFRPLASGECIRAMEEVDRLYYAESESSVWVRTPVWRIHPDQHPENTAV